MSPAVQTTLWREEIKKKEQQVKTKKSVYRKSVCWLLWLSST